MRWIGSIRATTAAAIALMAPSVLGAEAAREDYPWLSLEKMMKADALTADWAGLRPVLTQRGVSINGSYVGEVLANMCGGRSRAAIYEALLELGIDIDTGKLFNWTGGTIHGAVIDPHGASLTQRAVGDLGVVSAIDAYDSLRLYEAWLEQKFLSDRFSMRVGFMAADAEFAVMDTAAPFVHSAFGTPIALTNNFAMSTYPYSALGMRVAYAPSPGWSLMIGAYDGNVAPGVFRDPSPAPAPSNEFNHWGTHFALRSDEGAMLFAEIGWRTPSLPENTTAPGGDDEKSDARPLSAFCKVGVVYHTDKFEEVGRSVSDQSPPRGYRGNYAVYGSVEREVWREPGTSRDGLGTFVRATAAPDDRNTFEGSVEGGLVYSGLWQSGGRDRLALGGAWFKISDRISEGQRRDGLPEQDFEAVIELTYQYQLAPWCVIQPDVQWVIHPGGSGELGNALVLGMRMTVTF